MTTVESISSSTRSNRTRYIVIAVVAVVAVLIGVLATRPAADSAHIVNPLVGKQAPAVTGTALDGRAVDLASMRGRYVIVNFFATWCIECRDEHPALKAFSERHQGATSPTIIGVAFDANDLGAARSFFAKEGGTWPVVGANGSRIAVDYGVRGLPESYVVDPQGNISAHVTGGVTSDQLDALTGGIN